ncbi:GntR family transcriptional regulator [Chloroflexales bacterium ZM16-3]|nr:GntR family transcriptional regulator [Chloroflexales bacterium ZM16-3]
MSNKPQTIAGYVLGAIRQRIIEGQYQPGVRLDQHAIAAELGASLIPVRESLRQLEAEGLVTILPHRGVFVVDLSIDDFTEIYRIREVLEELAIQMAIPNYGEADLERIHRLNEQIQHKLSTHDHAAALDLNQEFHLATYEPARQPLLLDMINGLSNRSAHYRQRYINLPDREFLMIADHQGIVDACTARDPSAAGQAVRRHLRHTLEGVVASITR